MDISNYIDISKLPEEGRNELLDFYRFLLKKYRKKYKKSDSNDIVEEDFASYIKSHSYKLDKNFKFNRDDIH